MKKTLPKNLATIETIVEGLAAAFNDPNHAFHLSVIEMFNTEVHSRHKKAQEANATSETPKAIITNPEYTRETPKPIPGTDSWPPAGSSWSK